jgi:hypothetical protein
VSRYEVRTYGLSAGLVLDKQTGEARELTEEEAIRIGKLLAKALEDSFQQAFEASCGEAMRDGW